MKTKFTLLFIVLFALRQQKINAQSFNYFFGNIHAHSSYSDGNKDSSTSLITTPLQDFNYAKTALDVDFYGICEHNHLSAGLSNPADWHLGVADANVSTVNGSFVALYGMEWGVISGGGHVIVYGYDSLIGWDAGDYDVYVAQNDYTGLWKKINAKPGGFAYLAHPQVGDYNNLLTSTLSPKADSAIVGMAARSGPAFSTNTSYSNPSGFDYIARYNEALSLGYHLGVGLDHDTHNSVFGKQTAGRLVILSTTLTQTNVLSAIRNMHFYSSDDWNAQVNFNISNQPMGTIYAHAGSPTLSVSITDPDLENTASIEVYFGIPGSGSLPTLLTSNTNLNSLNYTHTITNLAKYYYYIKITQTDGDVIWTSPIWYTRNDAVTTNAPAAAFNMPAAHCINTAITFTDVSTNAPTAWNWYFTGASVATSTLQNPTVTYTAAGTYTAILIAGNSTGSSVPLTKTITVSAVPGVTLTVSSTTICTSGSGGTTITLTGNPPGGTYSGVGVTGNVFNAQPTSGNHIANYTYTNTASGCYKTASKTLSVVVCTGIENQTTNNSVTTIYPNPNHGCFTLQIQNEVQNAELILINTLAQKVHQQKVMQGLNEITVTKLAQGLYTFVVLQNGLQTGCGKLAIE